MHALLDQSIIMIFLDQITYLGCTLYSGISSSLNALLCLL